MSVSPIIYLIVFAIIIFFGSYYLTYDKQGNIGNWFTSSFYNIGSKSYIYSTIIISLLFSAIIVYLATGKVNGMSISVILILTGLSYLIFSNAKGDGVMLSVPSVGYPRPPHTGLDGVSLQNMYPNHINYPLL